VKAEGLEARVAQVPPYFSGTVAGDPRVLTDNQLIEQYNQVIVNELSNTRPGADLFGLYLDNGVNRFSLFWDNIHPNGLGLATQGHEWSRQLLGQGGLPFQISDLTVRLTPGGVQDPMRYKQDRLTVGNRYYADAGHTLGAGIPSQLLGGVWLSTFDAHAGETRGDYLRFSVDRPVKVYVAYDPRATTVPNWLSAANGFNKLSATLAVNHPGISSMNLYRKNFAAGQVTLGGARASGVQVPGGTQLGNYAVIIKESQ